MLIKNARILIFAVLVILGGALLVYGLAFNSKDVSAKSEGVTIVVNKSEPELIKDASVGGVERDEEGNLAQTYGAGEAPPKACPT